MLGTILLYLVYPNEYKYSHIFWILYMAICICICCSHFGWPNMCHLVFTQPNKVRLYKGPFNGVCHMRYPHLDHFPVNTVLMGCLSSTF